MLKIKFDDIFLVFKLEKMKNGDTLKNHIFKVEKAGSIFIVFRKCFNSWGILGISDTPAKAYSLMAVFYEGVSCCTKGYVIEEDSEMRKISQEKVIDRKSIHALNNGDTVENDIFRVELRFDEYGVYFKDKSLVLFLGVSFSESGAVDIMESFVLGCCLTTKGKITYYEEK